MLVNHHCVAAVIFHADRVLILLDDHARMGRITAAVQVGRVTAMERLVCRGAIVVFSRYAPGSIGPGAPIRQPQVYATIEFFRIAVLAIYITIFIKAIPNNAF